MRKSFAWFMMGIGFTLGIVMGLLIQLPVITLPTNGKEFPESDRQVRQLNSLGNGKKPEMAVNSLGTVQKLSSVNNPLRGLKTSLHSVVYPTNNGSKSYLEEKSQHILDISPSGGSNPDKDLPISDQNTVPTGDGLGHVPKHWTRVIKNIIDGIFWTPLLENKCPRGFSDEVQQTWMKKSDSATVVKMAEGCGRMQNRMLTFSDGTHACARYRMNTDQIQGEIYSFYLSKLLKIKNLPPTALKLVNSKSVSWENVHAAMANSQWSDSKVIVVTEWIHNLGEAYIPTLLRNEDRQLYPIQHHVGGKSEKHLCDLMQWTDLIIFDYLTANLDRVVNNMFNKQWNSRMMDSPAHNLEKGAEGNLVFLDNESGLFHGYRLLDKYSSYHASLLGSLCVFRNSTAALVGELHSSKNAGDRLHKLFTQSEPLHPNVPKMPKKNMNILQQRVDDVYAQIQKCKLKFGV